MTTFLHSSLYIWPLVLLAIVWMRFTLVELRYLLLPLRNDARIECRLGQVITPQTTGRAHDLVHVPHDSDMEGEPLELAGAMEVRRLEREYARGAVVRKIIDELAPKAKWYMHELSHQA